jgi:hypothetical protein
LFSALWLAYIILSLATDGPPYLHVFFGVVIAALVPSFIVFLVGLGITRIWERFGHAHWLRLLPEHVRKGLARLYVAIGVPWTIWFGYNFLEARPREFYRAFFSLLIVPVGGPILLLLIVWIVNGFRKSISEAEVNKKTPTAMDALIKLSYGNSPPRKEDCDLREAIESSFEQLLGKVVDIAEVRTIATGLYNAPMPNSTHGLAVATALNLYRSAKGARHAELMHTQICARMIVLDWLKEKKVDALLASAFEHSLYERYKLQV